MKKNGGIEVNPYIVTDKSRPITMPSYDRVSVAVTLTVILMVISAILIGEYNSVYGIKKEYYPVGNGTELEILDDPEAYGGFRVIGEPITVIDFTETVKRGDWATIRIQGEPNAEYGITLYLKSGPSGNSALIPKKADEKGFVEWKWRIYKGTSTGKFKLVIKGIQDAEVCITYAEMHLTIID